MKKIISILFSITLLLSLFTACQKDTNEKVTPIGEISSFKFSVTDKDGTKKDYDVPFKEGQTVGEALQNEKLIEGTTSEYGLYVTTVNGITYDYEKDGYWWCFYIDEDMAATGVDAAKIETGKTYSFIATKS